MSKEHPTKFYLVPWSVGYQCFVNKPDGFSIEVVAVTEFDKLALQLRAEAERATELQNQIYELQERND